MNLKTVFLVIGFCGATASHAEKPVMECHTNTRTDELHCINIVKVIESDSIRYTELYQGGPGGLRNTGFIVAANCKTGVVHLKDKTLVTFAGGYGSETPLLKKLKEITCSAVPKQLKK